MSSMMSPQNRLAFFLDKLHGRDIETASIDYTDPSGPILTIGWRPIQPLGKDNRYTLVLVASMGLNGFSVYRKYDNEELSEDQLLLDFEVDVDIDKV